MSDLFIDWSEVCRDEALARRLRVTGLMRGIVRRDPDRLVCRDEYGVVIERIFMDGHVIVHGVPNNQR